jgi:hypothetical protein
MQLNSKRFEPKKEDFKVNQTKKECVLIYKNTTK